ncbi:MAG: T9SS type A sorting domain-containing protein, partial [Bacteroidales bacterium]|nr:T9SS type A sorting domain-containing protein [Bacteroidales bacterium]
GNAMDGDSYVETGTYTTSIVAVDSYGAESVCSFDYTILDNEAPVLKEELGNVLLVLGDSSTRTAEMDIGDCFTDPDGDFLSYSADNSSPTTVNAFVNTSVEISGSDTTSTTKLYLTAFKAGTATITLTATDPRGKSASQAITVAVRSEGETVIVYPNPVSGTLYVSTEQEEASTTVKVSTSTGSLVYEGTSTASAFNPAEVDFSGFAPGTYSVNVRYGSRDVTKKVVKI